MPTLSAGLTARENILDSLQREANKMQTTAEAGQMGRGSSWGGVGDKAQFQHLGVRSDWELCLSAGQIALVLMKTSVLCPAGERAATG